MHPPHVCCPRTTCPGHVMTFFGPRDDFLRVYVVVHAQKTPFCFEEELSELRELIYSNGKVMDKAAAIKRLIDKVFVEVKSDIVLLKGKTHGCVNDEKAAAISQLSDVANGGPPWRYAVRLPPLGVPVHAAPPIHVSLMTYAVFCLNL